MGNQAASTGKLLTVVAIRGMRTAFVFFKGRDLAVVTFRAAIIVHPLFCVVSSTPGSVLDDEGLTWLLSRGHMRSAQVPEM